MPKSSSPTPTITPMNPAIKTLTLAPNPNPNPNPSLALSHELEADFLHSYQQALLMDEDEDPELHQTLNHSETLDHLIFPDHEDEDDDDDEEAAAVEEEEELEGEENGIEEEHKPSVNPSDSNDPTSSDPNPNHQLAVPPFIDPTPYISSQFYTFNKDSHALMVRCILEGRTATTDEIQNATPRSVLKSWRAVWKDRNEDTAYLTAWKRIQDKLQAHLDSDCNPLLYFKSNHAQCVSHVEQWQEIVNSVHADPDLLRHLGLKETVDRIKQSWTVGAKFYGIPESFIRACVLSCPICSNSSARVSGGGASRTKRKRFEYTESFDVPAKDVQRRLQQLAAKHKVVLCIRQKYIRFRPFMAEVKDYACHRAGEPSSASGSSAKKARVFKREPYQSKRCGCGFRIRAIVPIANYNEKDKTFVYEEEGTAVFKLYAVHSGHEPGARDGNARIIHRMIGNKGGFELDPEIYGVREEPEPELEPEPEPEPYVNLVKDGGGDIHRSILLQQVQELKVVTEFLEGSITKMPAELLGSMSNELRDILHRLKNLGGAQHSEDPLVVGDNEVEQWGEGHDRIFAKDSEIIEEDNDFSSALGSIVPWDRIAEECHGRKMLMRESCKPGNKWLMKEDCGDFDEKSILNCGNEEEDNKLIKPLRHDGTIVADTNLVGMQVGGYYHDNTKWYDSPTGLDTVSDSGDGGFQN